MVYHSQQLDVTFSALSDPTRREIVHRLAAGERTISELADRFDMSLPAVSKHVRVLQSAGLATIERHGRVRRARLNPRPLRVALEWLEHYRRFWELELEQLAAYLEGHPTQEPTWPAGQPQSPELPQSRRFKSAARSARRGNGSSTRGRNRRK